MCEFHGGGFDSRDWELGRAFESGGESSGWGKVDWRLVWTTWAWPFIRRMTSLQFPRASDSTFRPSFTCQMIRIVTKHRAARGYDQYGLLTLPYRTRTQCRALIKHCNLQRAVTQGKSSRHAFTLAGSDATGILPVSFASQ